MTSAPALFGLAAPSMWRHVSDVQLFSPVGDPSNAPASSVDALLSDLLLLPCLTAVNFHSVCVSAAAFEQFCSAVAPRLQVLLFGDARVKTDADPLTHVGLLHELRVLVVDELPPLPSLSRLHQLEYLHVDVPPVLDVLSFAVTVRYLSAWHAVRSLSFSDDSDGESDPTRTMEVLLATAPPPQLDAAAAALVDWRQPISLTDFSCASYLDGAELQRCAAIPTLTRLQADVDLDPFDFDHGPPPSLFVFTQLQQLRLELDDNKLLPHMAQCNQLRVLELFFRGKDPITAKSLCAVVSANTAALEELRFSVRWQGCSLSSAFSEGDAGATNWCVLVKCEQLRVLELPLSDMLTPHLLNALAQAPAFQSLELALPASPWRCTPQKMLLRSALASSSWCSVRLFLPEKTIAAALRSLAAGLSKLLPPSSATATLNEPSSAAALHRLRVFVRRMPDSTERCLVLRQTNDSGSFEWQYEY